VTERTVELVSIHGEGIAARCCAHLLRAGGVPVSTLRRGRIEASKHRFRARYERKDIELLALVDEAHDTLRGPARQKVLYREFHEFADSKYETLSSISVAHICNLRERREYRERRMTFEKTRPTRISSGELRRPEPEGRAGYLRIDTVHQGDLDGVKGVYHINAVDEVTQWQVVGATERSPEAWLIPGLEAILEQFPFQIRGFHSDNGSEFINHTVAELLNKLLPEQTKSRLRRSNDNGLVETKNGAVIRKHMGFSHIESAHADCINTFYKEHFKPYLNFHRPCGVPELVTNEKGRTKRVYKWYATPLESLRQLPGVARFLRYDITLDHLDRQAGRQTDTGAAIQMQEAKRKLFAGFQLEKTA